MSVEMLNIMCTTLPPWRSKFLPRECLKLVHSADYIVATLSKGTCLGVPDWLLCDWKIINLILPEKHILCELPSADGYPALSFTYFAIAIIKTKKSYLLQWPSLCAYFPCCCEWNIYFKNTFFSLLFTTDQTELGLGSWLGSHVALKV